MSNDDYNSRFNAGLSGNIFAPTSAEGTAGFLAGQALARGGATGSAEWVIAPIVLAPFVAIFYPVATAAALSVGFAAEALANAVGLGANQLLRWVVVLPPVVAVFWTVCRQDQYWGFNRTYYLIRHVVRLLVFALLANGAAQNAAATAADLPAMAPLAAMFKTPIQLVPVLLMLVFWQVFFMRAYAFRLYWNRKLKSWWLRPQDFPPFYFTWRRATSVHRPQAPIAMPGRYGKRNAVGEE
jgi:hypothetical protein